MSDLNEQLSTMVSSINQLMFGITSQSEQIGTIIKTVKNLDEKYGDMAVEVTDMNGRIRHLEDDQFVDLIKADNIKLAAQRRVAELLGIEFSEHGGIADDSMAHDYTFYYPKFVGRIHVDARHAGLEGPRIYATPRKNYQALLDFINDWVPSRGVSGLKSYYDGLAAARRKKKNK